MLRRVGRGLLFAVVGYAVGAGATYGLTMWLSANSHDRALEATMTAIFVAGPAAAVLGFLVGVLRRPA